MMRSRAEEAQHDPYSHTSAFISDFTKPQAAGLIAGEAACIVRIEDSARGEFCKRLAEGQYSELFRTVVAEII